MSRQTLTAVGGLPGVGKSAVAAYVASKTGAILIRTDVVRKQIFPFPTYDPTESARVYAAVMERVEALLAKGESAVLDATFVDRRQRETARSLAQRFGADWLFFWVTAPEDLVRARIAGRRGDASDADFSVYLSMREQMDPPPRDHVSICNHGTLAELHQQIDRYFQTTL